MWKQIVIARKDIDMSPGKLSAQTGHGYQAYFTNLIRNASPDLLDFGNGDLAYMLEVTIDKDIVRAVDRGEIEKDNLYDELKKKAERNGNLEKIDCFYQVKPNIPMIVRECIYQYKQQLKAKED